MTTGRSLLPLLLLGASACASGPGYDYGPLREHRPTSILVLPPLNGSPEVEAPGAWLSTISRPLAERGYYVLPVHVVAAYMRDNGLPSAGEMHQVSLARIDEVLGADAVMYAEVEEWGSSYFVVGSQVRVTVVLRLVHVKTGTLLWQGRATGVSNASQGGGSFVSMLANAAVQQIVNSLTDPSTELARSVNQQILYDGRRGLLPGPYAPEAEP